MKDILDRYKLMSCERELVTFIGRRKFMWAVLRDIHPHIIRAYGDRPVYLRTDWVTDKLEIRIAVAFPPQDMRERFEKLCKDYYSAIPAKHREAFRVDKLES